MDKIFAYMILVAILLAIWNIFIKPLALDIYQQRLFELREELYDFADSGNTDFDSMQYKTLHERLTKVARFSSRFGIISSTIDEILISILTKGNSKQERESGLAYLEGISNKVEIDKYTNIESELDSITIHYLLWSNAVVAPLLFVGLVVAVLFRAFRRAVKSIINEKTPRNTRHIVGKQLTVNLARSVVNRADHNMAV